MKIEKNRPSYIQKLDLDDIKLALINTVPDLKNAKILLTGGTGFFGVWLIESFLALNDHYNLNANLFILSRNPEAFLHRHPLLKDKKHLHFLQGDVRNFKIPNVQITHIIHAATSANLGLIENAPLEMLETIVEGTKHTLNQALTLKIIPKILFISSGAVYGEQPSDISHLPETAPTSPNLYNTQTAYAVGKCMAEHLCYQYHRLYNLPIKIARCFAFIGPYLPLNEHFAIGNFINDGLNGNPINVKGDGSPLRSYQHSKDLIIWLWTILIQGKPAYPYNVGSDEDHNIATIAKKVAACFNVPVLIAKEPNANSAPKRYVPCIKRAMTELHLPKNMSFDEALHRTILWHSQKII